MLVKRRSLPVPWSCPPNCVMIIATRTCGMCTMGLLGAAQLRYDHHHQGPVECVRPGDQFSQPGCGMWMYPSKMPRSPGILSSEILCSRCSPRDLSPWPPVSTYVFTLCTSKDEWNCSNAAVYTVQLFPSLPCQPTCGIQAAMFDPQCENYFPQFTSCSVPLRSVLTVITAKPSSIHFLPTWKSKHTRSLP